MGIDRSNIGFHLTTCQLVDPFSERSLVAERDFSVVVQCPGRNFFDGCLVFRAEAADVLFICPLIFCLDLFWRRVDTHDLLVCNASKTALDNHAVL